MTTSRLDPLRSVEHVQVLVRAFSILEVIARSPAGIGLRDLSRLAGLHKSTAFRMVRTMAALGYVARIEDGKLYCIGDRLPGIVTGHLDERRDKAAKEPARRDRPRGATGAGRNRQ